MIKYKTFFGHAPALLPLSPQKVLYLIKKSKKEKIQLTKEIKYAKYSNSKSFRGGGRVV